MTDLQRGSLLKRISALFLDVILLAVLATGCFWLISTLTGYDGYQTHLDEIVGKYEEKYGISVNISQEEYDRLTEAEKANRKAADEELRNDPDALYYGSMIYNLTLISLTGGILLSFLVLEFIIPLFLKNGQTIGKKVFGLGVIQNNGVKLQPFLLFLRSILGKCLIVAIIPASLIMMILMGGMGIGGVILIGLIYLAELVLLFATKMHTPIHDLMAGTVVVDLSTQMVFDSTEEKLAYQKRIAAERAEDAPY